MTSYRRYCRHHKIAYHIFHQNLRYHQIMNDIPPSLVVFLNQYWPSPSSVVLAPNKTLVSRNLLENQIFSLKFPFTGRGQIYFFSEEENVWKRNTIVLFSPLYVRFGFQLGENVFALFNPVKEAKRIGIHLSEEMRSLRKDELMGILPVVLQILRANGWEPRLKMRSFPRPQEPPSHNSQTQPGSNGGEN